MQVRKCTAQSAETYASNVRARGRGTFQSKEMRDHVTKLLVRDGLRVQRGSIRGQNLHPEYVTDYVGTLETGFGNSQYQTFWSVLYTVEVY